MFNTDPGGGGWLVIAAGYRVRLTSRGHQGFLDYGAGRSAHPALPSWNWLAPATTGSRFYIPPAFFPGVQTSSLHYCSLLSAGHPDCLVFCVKAYWQSRQTQPPKNRILLLAFGALHAIQASPGPPRAHSPHLLCLSPAVGSLEESMYLHIKFVS